MIFFLGNILFFVYLDIRICILGSYSYIDPKYKVRTVEYTADKTGFHPALINFEDTLAQPVDSEAVRLAKEKHLRLYQKIAEANVHDIPINLPKVMSIQVIPVYTYLFVFLF